MAESPNWQARPLAETAPRVAVVGAGPCGLTAVKNLLQVGVSDIVCFEERETIGGQWAYRDDLSKSSVYKSTHTISSKSRSSFSDFPMPAGYPDFPSHQQILAYFNAYANAFCLRRHIRLRSQVSRVSRTETGSWKITSNTPEGVREETFSHLLIATGHHWEPNTPTYPGTFEGENLHSQNYKFAEPFRGKRVLVVGGGNSACDIAAEVSKIAQSTALSMRRGYHIVPKLIFGQPPDVALWKLRHLPKWCRDWIAELLTRTIVGRYAKYNLQDPKPGLMQMHPTLNTDVLNAIRHGRIDPRVGIDRLERTSVRFTDGLCEPFDVIIWATGYRFECPILGDLSPSFLTQPIPPLYLRMMPQECDNLFFIGLFQPIGCIWTLAEQQAQVAALQICGRLTRPADLGQRIRRESKKQLSFDASDRHRIEVDAIELNKALASEIRRAKT